MSNNSPHSRSEESETTWNIPHFFKTIGVVSIAVAGIVVVSGLKEEKKDTSMVVTPHDVIYAFTQNKDSFEGLPIIQIGNQEEIHTLKQSGRAGWYIFQDANAITYWKIRSGTVESNTYTLTR